MPPAVPHYEEAFAAAIGNFWAIKNNQQAAADRAGRSDGGTSGSVRAGKHMSPFEALIRQVVKDAGIEPDPAPSDTMYPKSLLARKAVPEGMKVDPEFDGMSYAERYATAFKRLDQERMLDATCVAITSGPEAYQYPNEWLSFSGFAAQLWGRCQHAMAVVG